MRSSRRWLAHHHAFAPGQTQRRVLRDQDPETVPRVVRRRAPGQTIDELPTVQARGSQRMRAVGRREMPRMAALCLVLAGVTLGMVAATLILCL